VEDSRSSEGKPKGRFQRSFLRKLGGDGSSRKKTRREHQKGIFKREKLQPGGKKKVPISFSSAGAGCPFNIIEKKKRGSARKDCRVGARTFSGLANKGKPARQWGDEKRRIQNFKA